MEYILIKEFIKKNIIDKALLSLSDIIEDNVPLKEYGLDSIGLINLIIIIEEEYSIEFGYDELDLNKFTSIDEIAKMILNKIG